MEEPKAGMVVMELGEAVQKARKVRGIELPIKPSPPKEGGEYSLASCAALDWGADAVVISDQNAACLGARKFNPFFLSWAIHPAEYSSAYGFIVTVSTTSSSTLSRPTTI